MPIELIAIAAAAFFLLRSKASAATSTAPSAAPAPSMGDLFREAFSVKNVSAAAPTPASLAPAPAPAPAPALVSYAYDAYEPSAQPAPAPAPAPVQRTAYDAALANPASIPRFAGETQEQAIARVSGWASDQRQRIAGSNELRSAWNATTPAENQIPLRTF